MAAATAQRQSSSRASAQAAGRIPGRTNPTDFLTRKTFPDSPGTRATTSRVRRSSSSPRLARPPLSLRCRWSRCRVASLPARLLAAAVRVALPSDPVLGPLVAAAQGKDPYTVCTSRCAFVCRDGLFYRRSRRGPRGDHLSVPAACALCAQVLHELHAAPLFGHVGRDKTLALARRGARNTCAPARRVNASKPTASRRPACCSPCQSPRDAEGASAWTFSSCPSPAPATTLCRCLHEALGASLTFGWPHRHRITSKVLVAPDGARDCGSAAPVAGPPQGGAPGGCAVCCGDEVLLDTEHTPLPSRSLLSPESPRWMGPFRILARTAPNTCRLDISATWRIRVLAEFSTSNACAGTFDDLIASAATRMPVHHSKWLAQTACPSTSEALWPAVRIMVLDRPRAVPGRGGRHEGAARQPDQLRGRLYCL